MKQIRCLGLGVPFHQTNKRAKFGDQNEKGRHPICLAVSYLAVGTSYAARGPLDDPSTRPCDLLRDNASSIDASPALGTPRSLTWPSAQRGKYAAHISSANLHLLLTQVVGSRCTPLTPAHRNYPAQSPGWSCRPCPPIGDVLQEQILPDALANCSNPDQVLVPKSMGVRAAHCLGC